MAGRDDTHRLGWLGVGRMGVEMGRRLLDAGCDLAVFNRSMGKAEPLIRLGAKPAGSAAELAARDIVFMTVGSSEDRKSTRLNSSHPSISYAVFCLKKKKKKTLTKITTKLTQENHIDI